ncbi:PTS fructose transporter subunit IIB [Clostridium oceanicum]|uniref:PTS EIIB type-2 domain-containing protein n=1 Tax=Clostridium oceanicum TaxID=1543 RepID=A0ABN1JAL6_9CLOT
MKILGITACPTGVAHTYLAATKLKEAAEARGHSMKVEKQGALGAEDELSFKEIKDADVIIMALMVGCEREERFVGKKVLKVAIGDVLKDAEAPIIKAENLVR